MDCVGSVKIVVEFLNIINKIEPQGWFSERGLGQDLDMLFYLPVLSVRMTSILIQFRYLIQSCVFDVKKKVIFTLLRLYYKFL